MNSIAKIGDKVKCINDKSTCLRFGKIYTVKEDCQQYDAYYFEEEPGGWHYDRFELVERSEPITLRPAKMAGKQDRIATEPDLSNWQSWANNKPGECVCGILRTTCEYHRS